MTTYTWTGQNADAEEFQDGAGNTLTNGGGAASADVTYYVSTTGSNDNDGLTAGAPFATVAKALEVISLIKWGKWTPTIQLADGTSVGTAHIVCKNLELRLGIDRRLIADQQVVVLLECISLLGNFIHDDLSVENACGSLAKNPLVVLVALTIGLLVVYQGMVIHMLLFPKDGNPFQGGLDVLPVLIEVEVVSREFSAE